MPLDPKFTKFSTASPVIVSYDFYDLSTLTGYKSFYCGNYSNGEFILTTIQFYSQNGYLNGAHDTDFDLSINEATTLKGNGIVNIPWKIFHQSPAGSTTWRCVVTLYHYDGSTETSLATDTIDFDTGYMGVDTTKDVMGAFKLANIDKHFKAGDTIRLNITVSNIGGAAQEYMGIDPMNRSNLGNSWGGDWEVSQTKVTLPFKLDL